MSVLICDFTWWRWSKMFWEKTCYIDLKTNYKIINKQWLWNDNEDFIMIPALVSKCISCMGRGYNSWHEDSEHMYIVWETFKYFTMIKLTWTWAVLLYIHFGLYATWSQQITFTMLQRRYKTFNKRYVKAQGRTWSHQVADRTLTTR